MVQDNGVEALALLRSHTQSFDLVITDLTMPELTGYELVRATREFAPGIPVILCSGYSPQVSAKKAEELVVDAILTKPIAIQELARIVRRVLDRAEK